MEKLRGRPQVYSAEIIQKIYDLYDNTEKGYGLIGKELGIPRSTVHWYVQKRKKENPAVIEQQDFQ